MTVKIPLHLRGLDLRDFGAYDQIDPTLTDLSWEAHGGVSLAIFYSDDPPDVAVRDVADCARLIEKLMPGVCVVGVHDELVSLSDIAARAGVATEAVRLWASGRRRSSLRAFPSPRQAVGSGLGGKKTMNLYAWREVVSWIREVIGTDPDEGIQYLSDAQLAHLNAELVDIPPFAAWQPINIETERIIADVQQLCSQDGSIETESGQFIHRYDDTGIPRHRLKLRIGS